MKHTKKLARRSLAGLLALLMLLAAFPLSVFAAKQSIDDILAELKDYDALYDKTGIVASYDFSDLKAGTAFPSGDTVQLKDGLSLEVLDGTKKVDGTKKYVRTYEEGYLSFSANNRLLLSGLTSDAYTVTVDFAYNQYNATPVNYTAVEGTYGTDWVGSRWREVFAMGGLNVASSYMTPAEKEALVAQVKEYQSLVAEYEKYDPSIDNSEKDNQINFLQTCSFTLANGLKFGDVYYLLNEDLVPPDPDQLSGEGERFDAKYYEYLEYDVNFYEQWKTSGVAAGSLKVNGANATVTDNKPTAQSVLSASYEQRLSFTMAYDAANGEASVWSNGSNVVLSNEGASGIASLENAVLLSDVAADVYAIYVYEGVASDKQIKQNHFADIAKYYGLNIFSFLRLPEDGKAQVYEAFAGVSISALTQKKAQALLDDTIDNLGALSFDYESLYVNGNGSPNLIFDWNAFDKSVEDNNDEGYVSSTTIVDKNDVGFTVPANSSWGEQSLLLDLRGSKTLSFKNIVPKVEIDGFSALDDVTFEFMMSYRESGAISGTWAIGPMSIGVNQVVPNSMGTDYGPISGIWMGGPGWGVDTVWNETDYQPRWISNPYGVPFHAGIYLDTEINKTNLEESTYSTGLYRNGAAATNGTKTHFNSKAIAFTPTAELDRFEVFKNLVITVYAIRIYDDVLEPAETMQNIFADFCSMFRVNMTTYTLLPEEGQKAVRAAVAALDISGINDKAAAQKALDGIIAELPASVRYDYSFLYDHDIDGDGDEDELLFDWDAFGKTSLDNGESGKVTSTNLTDNLGNSFAIDKNAEWGEGYLYNAGTALKLTSVLPYSTGTKDGSTVYYYDDFHFDLMVAHTERLAGGTAYIGPFSISLQTKNNVGVQHQYPIDESYGPMSGTYWAAWKGTMSWNEAKQEYVKDTQQYATDVHWSTVKFLGNYPYKSFRFGFHVDTTNDKEKGEATFNFTYFRDGKVLTYAPKDQNKYAFPSPEYVYEPSSAAPKLEIGAGVGFRYYSIRLYDQALPEDMAAKNNFADKMRFYGLDPISYISGTEAQRELVHALLDNENIGDTQIETMRGKYEAIYAEESNLTVEDLYAQDRLLFAFDAFNLDENTDVTTLVGKNGVKLVMPEGAQWKIENGALILGDKTNGAITLSNILSSGAYTVQILMAYRSGAENGYNKANGDIERDTFRFGGVTLGNVMNKNASYIVQSSPIKMNGATVGKVDGFTDLDTYSGSVLAGNAGEIFELTVSVNASSTQASPSFYRNGELVFTLGTQSYASSKDVVIGDYADLAVYAIRIYGTKLGADAINKNHFADLLKYYGVDMAAYNQLTQVRREALVARYANVNLADTSYLELTQSLAEELAAQLIADTSLNALLGFDGYSVKLWGGTGVRANFTLNRAALDAVAAKVSEIGVLYANGSLPYLTTEGASKTVLYNANGYASNVGTKGSAFVEVALANLTAEEMNAERYFRSYAILKTDAGAEITVYGDMSSEIFGDSVSMTELMARFNEHGTVEGGGLSPMALYAGSDAYIAYITSVYQAILAIEEKATGDASYAKALLLAAETALKQALAIKEGKAPANNTQNASNAAALADAAEKAALDVLRQAELDASLMLADAHEALDALYAAKAILAAGVDYGYAAKATLEDVEKIVVRAEEIVLNGITDEMTLIASSARNAALLAEKASSAVASKDYGANDYLRVLYVGSGDLTGLYDQMKIFADAEGYDDVILASLDYAEAIGVDVSAVYRKMIGDKWFSIESISFAKALADEAWDVVILSPTTSYATKLDTDAFAKTYTELAKAVRGTKAKLYYGQGWAPSERQAAVALSGAKHDGEDASRIYSNLMAYAKALPTNLFDGVLPTATLLENLRTSVYIDAIYNWKNGYLLSDVGAYATSALILSGISDFSTKNMNRLVLGMEKAEENDWLRESLTAAIKTPNAITKSSISVSTGIHEEDDNIIRFTAMGASNISNGNMYSWILTYMATRNPTKQFVMLNEGVPGEGIAGQTDPTKGISGGVRRAEFIVDAGADVVLVHYGVYNAMTNLFDRTTNGLTTSEATKKAKLEEHKKAMEKILTLYRDNGIDVIFSCEGYVIKPDHNWQTDGKMTINDAYAAVTQMYKDTMTAKNPDGSRKYPNVLGVVDTTTHFSNIIKQNGIIEDKLDSNDRTIFGPDGLHISSVGGAVYADILFDEVLGSVTESQSGIHEFASDIVSDVTIKADGTANAKNATVKNVKVTANGVSYKYLANAIPIPANSDYLKANSLKSVNMTDINQEIIRVKGLSGDKYDIKIDGTVVGTYTATELNVGVNIAELANNPAQKQAQEVYTIVRDMVSANSNLNQFDYCNYVFYTIGYIDREYNFRYNEKEGRYYDESDLRAYIALGLHGGWYGERMTEYFNDSNPEVSTFAKSANNLATINKCTYRMHEAAKPIERTIEIVKK